MRVSRIKAWIPVLVWMFIIFLFSGRQSVSVSDEQMVNFLFFKTLHITEYGVLYVLMYRAIRYSYPADKPFTWFLAALLLSLAYAVTDEIHQVFVPTREGRPRDVIIDAIGMGLAWIFIKHWLPRSPKKLRKLAVRLRII